MVELQVFHRLVKRVEELLLRGERRDLGLDDHLVARQLGQHVSQLHLGRTVAASGLDVIDPQLQRPVDGRLEIGLSLVRHFAGINVIPLVLVAHSPAGEHRHLNLRLAESTIFHVAAVSFFTGEDTRRTKRLDKRRNVDELFAGNIEANHRLIRPGQAKLFTS